LESGTRGELGVVDADLLLIHGFWSSPATWDKLTARLTTDPDLAGLRVHAFGYESPKLPRWSMSQTRIPDYNDIAQSLPAYIAAHTPGDAPLVVVTHSQGGLILQRFLVWMLAEGRARELARIRSIVMLACPNEGSEYLASIRATTGLDRNPQAAQLEVLDREVGDARRIVLRQIVHATTLDDRQCPIAVYVYAGRTDNIVTRQSAQSAFPTAAVLPGDHFTIHNPDAPGNLTHSTLKRHILTATGTSTHPAAKEPKGPTGSTVSPAASTPSTPTQPVPSNNATEFKYSINIGNATGVVIGDGTTQTNYFGPADQIVSAPAGPTAPSPRGPSATPPPSGPLPTTGSTPSPAHTAEARDEQSDVAKHVFWSQGEPPPATPTPDPPKAAIPRPGGQTATPAGPASRAGNPGVALSQPGDALRRQLCGWRPSRRARLALVGVGTMAVLAASTYGVSQLTGEATPPGGAATTSPPAGSSTTLPDHAVTGTAITPMADSTSATRTTGPPAWLPANPAAVNAAPPFNLHVTNPREGTRVDSACLTVSGTARLPAESTVVLGAQNDDSSPDAVYYLVPVHSVAAASGGTSAWQGTVALGSATGQTYAIVVLVVDSSVVSKVTDPDTPFTSDQPLPGARLAAYLTVRQVGKSQNAC
jgi:hypothetical protein